MPTKRTRRGRRGLPQTALDWLETDEARDFFEGARDREWFHRHHRWGKLALGWKPYWYTMAAVLVSDGKCPAQYAPGASFWAEAWEHVQLMRETYEARQT